MGFEAVGDEFIDGGMPHKKFLLKN